MKYRELAEKDDCTKHCPFFDDVCPGGMKSNSRGMPIQPPCAYWDDAVDVLEKYLEHLRECNPRGKSLHKLKRSDGDG